jgi:hypothetical protein
VLVACGEREGDRGEKTSSRGGNCSSTRAHIDEARADEARDWCWLVVRTARNKRHGASRDEPFHACFEFAPAFFKQQDGSNNNNNNINKDFLRQR